MLTDIVLLLLCFSCLVNSLLIMAIQYTVRKWLPRIKEWEKDAETLKLELWGRL
jgi:hypothetical protein